MSAPVTKRHREITLRQWPQTSWRNLVGDVDVWLERGHDLGPFNLLMSFSQALADVEASALAEAPLAPTGGGEIEHLERASDLFYELIGDVGPDAIAGFCGRADEMLRWCKAETERRKT